jgi:hypothetical protein
MSPKSPKKLHRAMAAEQERKYHSRYAENEIAELGHGSYLLRGFFTLHHSKFRIQNSKT